MKITATDNNGYSVKVTLTKKDWASKEEFLNNMVILIVLICDQIALRTGNDDLGKRKPLVSQILNIASECTESILDDEYAPNENMVTIEGSELIAFMDKIYMERIGTCWTRLGKETAEEVFEIMRKDAEYSLGYDEDSSWYHFYICDGGEFRIPIGDAEKNDSDDEIRKEAGCAFIFASRLLGKALGDERSAEILKKYRSIECMYDQIREREGSGA